MTELSHGQIQQYLHIGEARLTTAERSAVTTHLAECEPCRTYADQLAALQPALIHALRKRPVVNSDSAIFNVKVVQIRFRRATMRNRILVAGGALIGIVVVTASLFVAQFGQAQPTGAAIAALVIPTVTATASPTATASSTPTSVPTDIPAANTPQHQTGSDHFEPNDDFAYAAPIEVGVKYDNLNFAQLDSAAGDNSWDNDYFKVQVKARQNVTCRTLDLSAGTDTNLILYDEYRNGIEGNDDVDRAAGNRSSSVTYVPTYDTWLYVLVGEGFHRPPAEAAQAIYSLECSQEE